MGQRLADYTMSMLRVEVHKGRELFPKLKSSWQELVRSSSDATPFQTFEWHETWWQYYCGLKEPIVITLWDQDQLVGLMPLTRTRGVWRALRPMGMGPSDYLHPLSADGYEQQGARSIAEWLKGSKGVDLIDLHQVRETRPLVQSFPCLTLEQATCLVLELPTTYEAYLETLSKSLRYDVRKLDKSLFKTGRAQIEEVGPDRISEGMDILFEQHKLRWRKRGLPGAFLGKGIAFHKEWAAKASANGWLWLSILRVDGEPIGAIYAMAMGKTAYYYQAGFDPSKGAVSPGTLLVAYTIRRAIDAGMSHFDFMRGDEPYKRRWKPQLCHRNLRLIAPSHNLRGELGSTWNQAGSKVESRVRARLEGKGLI